jgi:quinol monooxygenase YgiN
MSYVVIAKWIARAGSEDAVAEAIRKLIDPSRAESGCLEYRAHQSVSDSRLFLLYEEYVDEAAYRAHAESVHFARHAIGEGIPLLEAREREFYTSMDIDPASEA